MTTLVVTTALPKRRTLSERERNIWSRVGAHLGAAFRVRRRVGSLERAEAIFSPTGALAHAPALGAAEQDAVREGIQRRTHARKLHAEPEAALDVWRGLVDGRWSLVDYLDSDGKAFVLAMRNEPARELRSALTDRQRAAVALASLGYGNKQVAYSLGISTSAVAMLLARAREAGGFATRADLVRAFKVGLSDAPSTGCTTGAAG